MFILYHLFFAIYHIFFLGGGYGLIWAETCLHVFSFCYLRLFTLFKVSGCHKKKGVECWYKIYLAPIFSFDETNNFCYSIL